jgi:hypothetical protein
MMVQQSGCFDVVERGQAMQNIQQERSLAAAGEMRQESNIGKGQMQAADFVATPNVQIGANTSGGIGGFLGGKLGIIGAIAGGLKFKDASTSLLLADVRSSIQVAAAEGKASKMDFSIGGWGLGRRGRPGRLHQHRRGQAHRGQLPGQLQQDRAGHPRPGKPHPHGSASRRECRPPAAAPIPAARCWRPRSPT